MEEKTVAKGVTDVLEVRLGGRQRLLCERILTELEGVFLTVEIDLKLLKKGECLWRKLDHVERRHLMVLRWLEIREGGDGHDGSPLLLLLHHQLHRVDILNLSCEVHHQFKLWMQQAFNFCSNTWTKARFRLNHPPAVQTLHLFYSKINLYLQVYRNVLNGIYI